MESTFLYQNSRFNNITWQRTIMPGVKSTCFNHEIIKTHSTVAFSTFYTTHFFRQFVAFKKNLVDSLHFYSPLLRVWHFQIVSTAETSGTAETTSLVAEGETGGETGGLLALCIPTSGITSSPKDISDSQQNNLGKWEEQGHRLGWVLTGLFRKAGRHWLFSSHSNVYFIMAL